MSWFIALCRRLRRLLHRVLRLRVVLDTGQTTAEYGLVMVVAGAIAVLALTWARGTDSIGDLFDTVVKQLVSSVA